MSAGNAVPPSFEFGGCQVSLRRRELKRSGQIVVLGSRAFDILVTLIERRGKVVSKDELMESVWPGRIVEENTLEAQISALRRALGEDRRTVRTVSGRGYQFTGELTAVESPGNTTGVLVDQHLPVGVTPLIGREVSLRQIAEIAAGRRLITLVGSGGVGKTRLAIEVARSLAPRFAEGTALIELGLLGTPEFVSAAVAEALGFPQAAGTPSLDRIASLIRTRRMLLVLDNCEHLIEAAAQMAEILLESGTGLSIIATSREPLRASGEYLYRVPSLDVPAEENHDIQDILRHSALQLFNARAGGAANSLSTDIATACAARICRQLDGIPLAIELAAARVGMFGIEGVAARIEDCFNLLTSGVRTALPQQRTLRATFDWSFDLLQEPEKAVLARLGVFGGAFTLDAATSVVSSGDIQPAEVVDCVARLVETSLVSVVTVAPMQYRLLETTRLYARNKLADAGGFQEFSLRHAQYHVDVLRRAEADWEELPTDRWLGLYGRHLEGVRAAIAWSFSQVGDLALGAALTASAIPLWMQMGLFEEFLARVDTALAQLEREDVLDPKERMKLYAAQGTARLYQGAKADTAKAFGKALEIATRLDDKDYTLRAIWGLWAVSYLDGEYAASLAHSTRFTEAAAGGPHLTDRLVGDRMTGMSLLCLGRLERHGAYSRAW
jgi:predicted ATPase/DNA-binding winged helix-turn-helix (wHTH) protein